MNGAKVWNEYVRADSITFQSHNIGLPIVGYCRPTFALVLEELLAIREALPDTTVPLQPILSPRQVPRAKYRKVSRQLPRFGSKAALGSFGEHLQAGGCDVLIASEFNQAVSVGRHAD